RDELYHLREDKEEKTNLADRMPEKLGSLRKDLARWRESVGAQLPTRLPGRSDSPLANWTVRTTPGGPAASTPQQPSCSSTSDSGTNRELRGSESDEPPFTSPLRQPGRLLRVRPF